MKIGIIGGSGLDDLNFFYETSDKKIINSYGETSSPLKLGKIQGVEVVLIARHGRNHQHPPTNVNNRANIKALKDECCTHIISKTACGSLRKDIERGDFIIPDQFIDFTRHRPVTFHEAFDKEPKHTPMSDPFDKNLRALLSETSKELGYKTHNEGTLISIEGPRFSTRAESKMFRSWGADIINMSIAPEAILANEAKISYATIAMSTDFDCLFEDIKPVSWEDILEVFNQNSEKVKTLLIKVISKLADQESKNH